MNPQCEHERPSGRCLRDAGHQPPCRAAADYAAMPLSAGDAAAVRDAIRHNTARRELRAENVRLREALAFYANEEAWHQMLAGQGGSVAEAGPTVAEKALTDCPTCSGEKIVEDPRGDVRGVPCEPIDCPRCDGTGVQRQEQGPRG